MATFDDDFADLLPDTISVAIPASRNAYGETTLAAPVQYPGRVMRKSTARRTLTGETYLSPMHCVINCQTIIPMDAVVTIPDDATPHLVAESELFRDENNNPHHVTVYFAA